jgi:hypothetical protein
MSASVSPTISAATFVFLKKHACASLLVSANDGYDLCILPLLMDLLQAPVNT